MPDDLTADAARMGGAGRARLSPPTAAIDLLEVDL